MLILGIDPGLANTAYGLVNYKDNKFTFVHCGTVSTSPKEQMAIRVSKIFDAINSICREYKPQQCAIEEVFVNKNNLSSLMLGHARGVAMASVGVEGVAVYEYSAKKIKKSIVGNGNATKEQMAYMMRILLPKNTAENDHEVDALATAIHHAHFGAIG